MRLPSFGSFIAVVVMLAAGCGSHPGPREQMEMTKSCAQTRCDSMSAEGSNACVTCLSACASASYNCNGSSACKASCSEREVHCSEADQTECVKTSFTAALPENASGELEAACNRLRVHTIACGLDPQGAEACRRFARVERPELSTA